jgi:hypothetical protein
MKTGIAAGLMKTAIVATTLVCTPVVFAGPAVSTPEMKTALAKADASPEALRRYVHRTRAIYGLNYLEVMAIHEARAARERAPVVATRDEAREAPGPVRAD